MAILTIPEVAKKLRIGRSAAYELARRPDFPKVYFGRWIRVPSAALDRWVAAQLGEDARQYVPMEAGLI